jgi:hypothetical protein
VSELADRQWIERLLLTRAKKMCFVTEGVALGRILSEFIRNGVKIKVLQRKASLSGDCIRIARNVERESHVWTLALQFNSLSEVVIILADINERLEIYVGKKVEIATVTEIVHDLSQEFSA